MSHVVTLARGAYSSVGGLLEAPHWPGVRSSHTGRHWTCIFDMNCQWDIGEVTGKFFIISGQKSIVIFFRNIFPGLKVGSSLANMSIHQEMNNY
jgi:hypothetical protein